MLSHPDVTLTLALSGLAGLALLAVTGLKGLMIWADVKRAEMEAARPHVEPASTMTSRIEIADLKERLRKLEAIADGVGY